MRKKRHEHCRLAHRFSHMLRTALAILLLAHVDAHVPLYDFDSLCNQSCCEYPHSHTTSQVAYLKGRGGIELHVADLDTQNNEIIDFDVVFKYEYDLSTFDVYVGCGGCMPEDPLLVAPSRPSGYQSGKLEPFTQTGYFPLFKSGSERQFHTELLSGCPSAHWTIRLVDYKNRSEAGHEVLVWGAVVGCEDISCEIFTAAELISFPLYVNRNHGHVWNDVWWSLPFLALVQAFLMVMIIICASKNGLADAFKTTKRLCREKDGEKYRERPHRVLSPRAVLYAIALWALGTDLLETFWHFLIAAAQVGGSDSKGYGLFFGVVFLFGKVAPLVLVALIWHWLNVINEKEWRRLSACGGFCCQLRCKCGWTEGFGFYSPLWAHGAWSILELVGIGIAGFFWLGAGYFVFPSAIVIASLIRIYVWAADATTTYDIVDCDPEPKTSSNYTLDALPSLTLRG